MKKHLLISLLLGLFILILVGCGILVSPTDVKIENGKVSFTEVSGASSYSCEVKKDDGSRVVITINNNEPIETLNLGLGRYEIRVKAVSGDTESPWSEVATYSSNKLQAPTGVEIKNNKLYFNDVKDANLYHVVFLKDGKQINKDLNSGQLLTNLGLPEGTYDIYVIADNNNYADVASDRSEKVTYSVVLEELDTPTGLSIEEGYLFFDVMAATDTYVVKFASAEATIEREVNTSGIAINELLIPQGTYKVSIKAKGDGLAYGDSSYSSEIDFVQEQSFMELKEKELIDGGYIKWMGRTYYNETTKANEVYHSASGFELFFKGSTVVATITATNYNSSSARPCIVIVVDDDFDNQTTIFLDKASQEVTLITGNEDLEEHKIDLYKRSESIDSHIAVSSIKTDGVFLQKIVNKKLRMEFIAASSSTGYGNLGNASSGGKTTANSDCLKGFAFLTAQAFDADINIFSASGWGCAFSAWTTPNTINVSDSYKYVDFKSSITWNPGKYVPDVIVVNLGTNDWSYIRAAKTDSDKEARMSAFQKKYVDFLKYLNDLYPDAQLVMLYGLMQESDIYAATEEIYTKAKVSIPNLAIIKINGDARGYNSHPSVESHAAIARTLTNFIKELLGE